MNLPPDFCKSGATPGVGPVIGFELDSVSLLSIRVDGSSNVARFNGERRVCFHIGLAIIR